MQKDEESPELEQAIRDKDVDKILKLNNFSGGTLPDVFYSMTPLHWAATLGLLELAIKLIDEGADIEAKDSDGKTPLLCAAISSDTLPLKALIDRSANINAKNNKSENILHIIIAANYMSKSSKMLIKSDAGKRSNSLLKIALESGADVNVKIIDEGFTPLHYACYAGYHEALVLLLEHGAEVDAKAANGMTPLHIASWKGDQEFVLSLLEHGADANAEDSFGYTPLRAAITEGHTNIVTLLEMYEQKNK